MAIFNNVGIYGTEVLCLERLFGHWYSQLSSRCLAWFRLHGLLEEHVFLRMSIVHILLI